MSVLHRKGAKDSCTLGRQIFSVSLRYRGPLEKNHRPFAHQKTGFESRIRFAARRLHANRMAFLGGRTAHVAFPSSDRLSRLEAVLFLTREPLSSRRLAQYADLSDGTEARSLVRKLNERLDGEGCAFHVSEVAGGFQFMSRPQFSPWLRRLNSSAMEVRLSGPALETLAVVAYRQPVLRAAVEAIRGVQCGEILRQLMERDLVKIVGRSEDLGRPLLYGTNKRFLQVFGLRNIDELPRQEWFELAELEANVESSETSQSEPFPSESREEHASNQLHEE